MTAVVEPYCTLVDCCLVANYIQYQLTQTHKIHHAPCVISTFSTTQTQPQPCYCTEIMWLFNKVNPLTLAQEPQPHLQLPLKPTYTFQTHCFLFVSLLMSTIPPTLLLHLPIHPSFIDHFSLIHTLSPPFPRNQQGARWSHCRLYN